MGNTIRIKGIGMILALLLTSTLYGQTCTPNQSYEEPGFYPDTLPHGMTNVNYKHTLHIRVIEDTLAEFGGQQVLAVVDSAVLKEIVGLPSGFTYTCDKPSCVYIPDSVGCATLEGTPTSKDAGNHDLKMVVTLYAKVFGNFSVDQTDTIDDFTLFIESDGTASIRKRKDETRMIYPNPSTGIFHLTVSSEYSVFDASGRLVLESRGSQIDLSDQRSGVYFLHCTDAYETRIIRLVRL